MAYYPAYAYTPMYGSPAYPTNQMPQQQPVNAPQSVQGNGQGLSQASRPVTSREEAMGIPADFSGSLMVFPDVTHNKIYIKRWNFQSGAADFIEFAPVVPEAEKKVQYATLEDLNALRDELLGKVKTDE